MSHVVEADALIVVTPVYEDREAASMLFREISTKVARPVFVVAVDDGSVRQPVQIDWILDAGLQGVVLRLTRNVGHQRAIAIGLSYVADRIKGSSHVVVMDSDGEDTPETIAQLVDGLWSDDVDVVVAQRKSRVETLKFRTFYLLYKLVFNLLAGRQISFGNFMAMKRGSVKRLAAMQELWIHVAGSVLTSKLRIRLCALDRGPRYAGRSKMNFVGLVLHGFRGLMVFAEDVLVRVGITCAAVAALSVVGAVAAIALKLLGYATPGWFSVALGILVLVFMQTGALTLMSLMLTGVVRGSIATPADYSIFIAEAIDGRGGRDG